MNSKKKSGRNDSSSTVNRINQIDILSVLDKLGIQYTTSWDSRKLYSSGDVCDWRVVNVPKNFINDFSHDRAKWWPFSFVMKYENFTGKETFKRFKDNFTF